jgi:hypothetical protein
MRALPDHSASIDACRAGRDRMQQSRLAYRLLFEEPAIKIELSPGREEFVPLFSSMGALATALAQVRGTDRVKGLAAFLAQILREGQRTCPEVMIQELKEVVRDRLKGRSDKELATWTHRLERALVTDNLSRGGGKPLSSEALYGELLYLAETAEDHYIITALPAERVISDKAEALREVLIRRLDIAKLGQSDLSPARYTFHLPTKADCIHWWDSLISEVKSDMRKEGNPFDLHATRNYLKKLDDEDQLRIYYFEDQSSLCGCPIVVFDPGSSTLSGFNLYYYSDPAKGDYQVSVAKMDSSYLQQWKFLFYSHLEHERIKRRRIRLADVLTSPSGI